MVVLFTDLIDRCPDWVVTLMTIAGGFFVCRVLISSVNRLVERVARIEGTATGVVVVFDEAGGGPDVHSSAGGDMTPGAR